MRNLILLTVSVLFLASCGGGGGADKLVTIKTEMGEMTVLLYDETPMHKANFIELAESGQYDSTTFHRIIEGFMIQGGDVFKKTKTQETETDRIPAEIVEGFYHTKGALAAARQPDNVNPNKQSSSCQFYIVDGKKFTDQELTTDQAKINQVLGRLAQQGKIDSLREKIVALQMERDAEGINNLILSSIPYLEELSGETITKDIADDVRELYTSTDGYPPLDGSYTIFGRVVEGMEVIDKIAAVNTAGGRMPSNLYMTMKVKTVSKSKITDKYGYEYPKTN